MGQVVTKDDKRGQRGLITAIDIEATMLRFEGYTYQKIEEKLLAKFGRELTPTERTLRNWFYRGGRLYDFSVGFAKNESRARKQEAMQILRAHLGTAARTLVSLMDQKSPGMIRFLSSKELINRLLGEPVKPIANLGPNDLAAEIIKEAGLLEETTDGSKISEDPDHSTGGGA